MGKETRDDYSIRVSDHSCNGYNITRYAGRDGTVGKLTIRRGMGFVLRGTAFPHGNRRRAGNSHLMSQVNYDSFGSRVYSTN
jgi:hypothetical protein